jgi:hypothetical protein
MHTQGARQFIPARVSGPSFFLSRIIEDLIRRAATTATAAVAEDKRCLERVTRRHGFLLELCKVNRASV